jgi:hypothetical protein
VSYQCGGGSLGRAWEALNKFHPFGPNQPLPLTPWKMPFDKPGTNEIVQSFHRLEYAKKDWFPFVFLVI